MSEAPSSEIVRAIRTHAKKTTVTDLAERGVRRVRLLDMATLERLFETALERAVETSLARVPRPVVRAFEEDAREHLREIVREELGRREPAPRAEVPERKRALLEVVYQENLTLRENLALRKLAG